MVTLNTVREPAEYSITSMPTLSRSTTLKSPAPRTPYPKFHRNPLPSPRPYSFVTAEGYIIEEFSRSRCISEPSRPKHRRFHSTPNSSSPGNAGAHKARPGIATRAHSVRRPSPLASPPSTPVPIPNVPFPYTEDPAPSLDALKISPASPAPIWPSTPRQGSAHVAQNLKLKKPRPGRTIEDGNVHPSFWGFFRSLFKSKAKKKRQEGRPTPNTLLINRHYTAKFIPPPPAGIRFSKLVIS